MKRGEITWVDKITIIRDAVSRQPSVTVEGLWSGKDRRMISRMLYKAMRKSSNVIIQQHKQADLIASETEEKKEPTLAEKRINALALARAAKKLKKELEEANKDVRGQK